MLLRVRAYAIVDRAQRTPVCVCVCTCVCVCVCVCVRVRTIQPSPLQWVDSSGLSHKQTCRPIKMRLVNWWGPKTHAPRLSVCLCLSLSVCLSVCVRVCLSVFVCLCVFLCVCVLNCSKVPSSRCDVTPPVVAPGTTTIFVKVSAFVYFEMKLMCQISIHMIPLWHRKSHTEGPYTECAVCSEAATGTSSLEACCKPS